MMLKILRLLFVARMELINNNVRLAPVKTKKFFCALREFNNIEFSRTSKIEILLGDLKPDSSFG